MRSISPVHYLQSVVWTLLVGVLAVMVGVSAAAQVDGHDEKVLEAVAELGG